MERKTIKPRKPVDEEASEEAASEEASHRSRLSPANDPDAEEDQEPWYDDEGELRSFYTPTFNEMVARIDAFERDLRAYFYGNPAGHFKLTFGRRRRAKRRSVMNKLDKIREDVEFDEFLMRSDGYFGYDN